MHWLILANQEMSLRLAIYKKDIIKECSLNKLHGLSSQNYVDFDIYLVNFILIALESIVQIG